MKPDYADICLNRNVVLHHSYKVKKVIACSELANVYAGRKLEDGAAVIVKEFYPRQVALRDLDKRTVLCRVPSVRRQYDELREAFLMETQMLQQLSHPNIVRLVDYFEENGTDYMIMEYCKGISLERFVEEGRLVSVADFLRDTILPLSSAIEYVHAQGIIHRDIKPANIIIGEDGQPKLLDFGSAIYYEKTGHRIFTSTGYSPLEFYSEKSKQGITSDVYSFAATMYFCLSGRTPNDVTRRLFQDNLESVRSLNRSVSPLMERTIRKGLAVRPDKRHASMKQMKAALHAERILLAMVERLLGKHKARQQDDRKQA
ncbi:serine/threonine protein kinase [Paenibacillus alvei]|uniref:Kinase domain protein n=1 Tax=Paenibacillus alvei TaxID=44250 RepID=A0A383R4A9_PAEAL|nr:serine/threonine-protein kinase [Paenibacillus alvei]SYX81780.1 Kinase domain protein [Paenibacillus alvei]